MVRWNWGLTNIIWQVIPTMSCMITERKHRKTNISPILFSLTQMPRLHLSLNRPRTWSSSRNILESPFPAVCLTPTFTLPWGASPAERRCQLSTTIRWASLGAYRLGSTSARQKWMARLSGAPFTVWRVSRAEGSKPWCRVRQGTNICFPC